MRWIEHRRHSMRDPGGVHLNAAGRALARRVGADVGPFERVETSPIPRAVETAAEMGWPPEATLAELGGLGDRVEAALGPITCWGDFGAAALRSPIVSSYAARIARLLGEIAARTPEGGQALVVSHGAVVELSAVASHPATPWGGVGEVASYLDGVRLAYDSGRCVAAQVVRAPRRGSD